MTVGAVMASALAALATPYLDVLHQRNPVSLLGALLFVIASALIVRAVRRGRGVRAKALWRLLARRSVWGHRSSRLDYKLYLVNLPLTALLLSAFLAGSDVWAAGTERLLAATVGSGRAAGASWTVAILIAVVQLLAADFAYWLGHFAMHRSKLLWEFHKLHHSAEVMTPATEFRQHPVELIWMPLLIGAVTGIVYALAVHVTGPLPAGAGLGLVNGVVLVHLMTFHHVRHSHIGIAFTGLWGKLLHSPAHHQLHHSSDPAHFDRNLGYILSVWDWMAGTLVMPRPGERHTLGIGPEGLAHNSVAAAMWEPVRAARALLVPRRGPGATQIL